MFSIRTTPKRLVRAGLGEGVDVDGIPHAFGTKLLLLTAAYRDVGLSDDQVQSLVREAQDALTAAGHRSRR